ncbi:MAG: hypothetical protein VB111_00360 [Clostridiaceae bacterium]|nr:hypothetical protein [Clostridiaceae bacterium]
MSLRFITPVDGQMLTDVAGVRCGDTLAVDIAVEAAPEKTIHINNKPAVWKNGAYHATIELDGYRNTIEAYDEAGMSVKAGIYWIPEATRRFAFSVDDNIWWLQDLTANAYTSIFDNPYLAVYKEAHDKYGIKVRLNLFYATDRKGGFNLSMMTDRYRNEFLANRDWLHLAFHSDFEFPEYPYSETTYAKLKYDYDHINTEAKRFAGYELERATTIHFGSGNRQAIRAIRSRGVKTLMGYMEAKDGKSFVSYYLTPEEVAKVNEYGFWKDHGEDMIYGRIDAVLNLYQPDGIVKHLDEGETRFPKKGFVEIMIHEQYFYEDYVAYMPNFRDRVLTGAKWCVEHGYTPMFSCDATAEW